MAALSALEHLNRNARVRDVFPELHAATQAITVLREQALPSALRSIDRIVVDEAQDLTILEFSVVIELCRAIEQDRGHAPWLTVGDHARLASVLQRVPRWALSYDMCPEIEALYSWASITPVETIYSAAKTRGALTRAVRREAVVVRGP